MPGEHLAHCLGYRKHSINGRQRYYYDIIMLLSSRSICQAPNYKSFLEEESKCSEATVGANSGWNRRNVSRDEAEGAQSPELLMQRGVHCLRAKS